MHHALSCLVKVFPLCMLIHKLAVHALHHKVAMLAHPCKLRNACMSRVYMHVHRSTRTFACSAATSIRLAVHALETDDMKIHNCCNRSCPSTLTHHTGNMQKVLFALAQASQVSHYWRSSVLPVSRHTTDTTSSGSGSSHHITSQIPSVEFPSHPCRLGWEDPTATSRAGCHKPEQPCSRRQPSCWLF